MYLTKEDLELIYTHIPDGELKSKIHSQIYPNYDLVEDIKREFKDVHSIWKSDSSSVYYAKFYDSEENENYDTPSRYEIGLEISKKYDRETTRIHIVEILLEDKDTKNDWMYSECDLIWMRK